MGKNVGLVRISTLAHNLHIKVPLQLWSWSCHKYSFSRSGVLWSSTVWNALLKKADSTHTYMYSLEDHTVGYPSVLHSICNLRIHPWDAYLLFPDNNVAVWPKMHRLGKSLICKFPLSPCLLNCSVACLFGSNKTNNSVLCKLRYILDCFYL